MSEESNDTEALAHTMRQREIVKQQLSELLESNPQLYYQPTTMIAREIQASLQHSASLSEDDQHLMYPLSVRDIEMLLAFHEGSPL